MAKIKNHQDREAFELIYQRYRMPLYQFSYSMLKNQALAEELAQDILIKIFTKAEHYEEGRKFSSWMWRVARNANIDFMRKKKEIHLETMYAAEEGRGYEEVLSSEEDSIDEKLIESARREMVENCFSHLSEPQREAMSLRIESELSYKEIADIMDKNEASIKSLINRAKRSLIDCVQKCQEDENHE
ncbi:MAG: RNA polymerase sigma factor [Halobacteriovoraceae bacterium]|nr:RNA polymerase sigma factor [Halobacteriovoraceae bacterium]